MFARIFALASLVAFALADQCDTGNIQCCGGSTSVQNYNSAAEILGLIPIVAEVAGDVGLKCSPISVVGTGAGCEANQEPLCCSNNQYNGLVNIGCTPINLNL